MTTHWSWWLSGLALASVPLLHWLLLNRALAVSGRYSALVDRWRFGAAPDAPEDTEALVAALRAETAAAFGAAAVSAPEVSADAEPGPLPRATEGTGRHLLFLFGLTAGGLVSAALAGTFAPSLSLHGETFARVVQVLGLPAPAVLVLGGVLVGFGTRMASGCTSGHGLCGVSQLQPGSLLATAAFFGAGVGVSLAFGALL